MSDVVDDLGFPDIRTARPWSRDVCVNVSQISVKKAVCDKHLTGIGRREMSAPVQNGGSLLEDDVKDI